jgi:hypothetical protein
MNSLVGKINYRDIRFKYQRPVLKATKNTCRFLNSLLTVFLFKSHQTEEQANRA